MNHDCESLPEKMMEVLYGEADDARRATVQGHLSACEPCRRELESLRALRSEIREARPDVADLPPARVVMLGRPPARPWVRAARWAAAAALAAVAVLGVLDAQIGLSRAGLDLSFGGGAEDGARLVRQMEAALEEVRREGARERDALLAAVRNDLRRREENRIEARNASLRRLATDWEEVRRQDLGYVLTRLGSLEERTGQEMQLTRQMIHYTALANQPLTEDR